LFCSPGAEKARLEWITGFQARPFNPREPRKVRIHLRGGDDTALVEGPKAGMA